MFFSFAKNFELRTFLSDELLPPEFVRLCLSPDYDGFE
jgi:hypothetical protein